MFIWDNWASLLPHSLNSLILFRCFFSSLRCTVAHHFQLVLFHTRRLLKVITYLIVFYYILSLPLFIAAIILLAASFGLVWLFACIRTIAIDSWPESVNLCNLLIVFHTLLTHRHEIASRTSKCSCLFFFISKGKLK